MVHKKRSSITRSHSPLLAGASDGFPLVLPSGDQCGNQVEIWASTNSNSDSLKLQCERALTALRRGNHTKALRLMKESFSRHDNSALLHRVNGTICIKVASLIEDPAGKQRHLKNALESAKKAVVLSPNSIEFAHFYANLLYEVANDTTGYDEVVQECERALGIPDPVDPAKESLQDESQQKLTTSHARISHVQQELRSLIQKANIASISSWMKNLGNGSGEEKFRLIPLRRLPEDPMEVRLVPTRRPNEIKKATKTTEERRKEIEVRVAAARLLQQKPDALQSNGHEDKICATSISPHRVGERRKMTNLKRTSTSDRMDQIRSFWNSLSFDRKKDLLEVPIKDLKAHFASRKDGFDLVVLSEALDFAGTNRTWMFWMCCRCGEKFADKEKFIQHVITEHIGNISSKLQLVMPQQIDTKSIDLIVDTDWKPIDGQVALKMCRSDLQVSSTGSYDNGNKLRKDNNGLSDEYTEYAEDTELIGAVQDRGAVSESDTCNGIIFQDHAGNFALVELRGHNVEDADNISSQKKWPLTNDTDCAELLIRIRDLLLLLIKHKCLAVSHLNKILQYTIDELESTAFFSELQDSELRTFPYCVFLLTASQLLKVLKFLQELSHMCGLGRSMERRDSCPDKLTTSPETDITEKLAISNDSSCLLLDPCLLDDTIKPIKADGSSYSNQNLSAKLLLEPTKLEVDHGNFLSWIFTDSSGSEKVSPWVRFKERKTSQSVEIIQALEKEFYLLQSLCERKSECTVRKEALQAVENLCTEESKEKINFESTKSVSHESVLKQRHEELTAMENDQVLTSGKYELNAISNVLKGAQLEHYAFSYNDSLAVTSPLYDMMESDDGDWRKQDQFNEADNCINMAIRKQKAELSVEVSKIDGRILRAVSNMQLLEQELESTSLFDYRTIVLLFVRLFLKAHLEDLADRDATEKSDAVREAFLAELALDSSKSICKGGDHTRHGKKKGRDSKKAKDIKAIGSGEQLHQANAMNENFNSQMCQNGLENISSSVLTQHHEQFRRTLVHKPEGTHIQGTFKSNRSIEAESQRNQIEGCEITIEHPLAESYPFKENRKSSNGHDIALDGCSDHMMQQPDTKNNEACGDAFLKNLNDPHGKTLSKIRHCALGDYAEMQCPRSFQIRSKPDPLMAEDDFFNIPNSPMPDKTGPKVNASSNASALIGENRMEVRGIGLQNEVGEYNCFLNVIIQSLWHLRRFREEFLGTPRSLHLHIGDPCVICALYDIFVALNMASIGKEGQAVAPTTLRIALSNLCPDSKFFQQAQMNDASEVMAVLFDCLHQSFTSRVGHSDGESEESIYSGSWDCVNNSCVVHTIFGMDIFEQMSCCSCSLDSRQFKYTSFFYNINASALRMMKISCPESSLDELLRLMEMNHQLACDPESGGCGKQNYIHHFLSTIPHIFTTVLGWQNNSETAEDISATLAAISTELDISALYHGLDPGKMHRLMSVVCYYGQHYHCFAYNQECEEWIMYDDRIVKVIGTWSEVVSLCGKGHLQPQVLFFESVD